MSQTGGSQNGESVRYFVLCHCCTLSVTVVRSVSLLYAQCHCFVFSVTVLCSVSRFCVRCHGFVFSVTVLCSVSLFCVQCHCFVFSVTVLCSVSLFCVRCHCYVDCHVILCLWPLLLLLYVLCQHHCHVHLVGLNPMQRASLKTPPTFSVTFQLKLY